MNRYENRMKFFEEVEGVKPNIYYHYTSLDALYSIISNKTLWLTSLKSSNDKKELYYTVDDFLRDFETVCKNEENSKLKICFETLKNNIDAHKEKFIKECMAKSKPYALCLSDKRDNLTHWDRYASSSTGVCIGINVAAMNILCRRTGNDFFGSALFDIGKALYTTEDVLRYIRHKTLHNMNVLVDVLEKEPKKDLIEFISRHGYIYVIGVCQSVMRYAKNTSFIDEGEVRFYFDEKSIAETTKMIDNMGNQGHADLAATLKSNFEGLVDSLKLKPEEFFLSRSGIRGYHKLCLDYIWGPGVIPEIILGPMCVQNRNELLRFLSENGLSGTKVCVSKVPLR